MTVLLSHLAKALFEQKGLGLHRARANACSSLIELTQLNKLSYLSCLHPTIFGGIINLSILSQAVVKSSEFIIMGNKAVCPYTSFSSQLTRA